MIDDHLKMRTVCEGKWKSFSKNHVGNGTAQKFFISGTVIVAGFGINAHLISIQFALADHQATLLAIGWLFLKWGILNDNWGLPAAVRFGRGGLGGVIVTHAFG